MSPQLDPSAPSPAAPSNTASPQSNGTKIITIVSGCVGGFIIILAAVLVIVPLSRRYQERRQQKRADSEHGSLRGHQRIMSGPDSSVPLLIPEEQESEKAQARKMPYDPSANMPHEYSGEASGSLPTSHIVDNSTQLLQDYDPWNGNAEMSITRPLRPPPTLRRAKTRVPHTPMATLPEDGPSDAALVPVLSPAPTSPTSPSTSSDTHPTWLHIPKPPSHSGVPLIGAFRSSMSSTTSTNTTLPSLQHYPSLSSRSRSPTTFYSLSSSSLSSSAARERGAATEHGELHPPPARLRASGGPQQMLEVQPASHLPPSRQASLLSAVHAQASHSERDDRGQGGFTTSTSASSLSVYTDARSSLVDENGRPNREIPRWNPMSMISSYWTSGQPS